MRAENLSSMLPDGGEAKVCRMVLAVENHQGTCAEVAGVAPDNNAAQRSARPIPSPLN